MALIGSIRIFSSLDGSGVSLHHLPSGGLYTFDSEVLSVLQHLQHKGTLPSALQNPFSPNLSDTRYAELLAFLKEKKLVS